MDIRTRITSIGGPSEVLKGCPAAIKSGMFSAAELWHQRMLPNHFQPFSGAKYGYKRRTAKYERRKRRVWGHTTPLVFSGRLKEWVERSRNVSGSSTRVTVKMTAPFYVVRYKTRPTMPDMWTELVKTTEDEKRRLGRTIDEVGTKEMNSNRERRVETI